MNYELTNIVETKEPKALVNFGQETWDFEVEP